MLSALDLGQARHYSTIQTFALCSGLCSGAHLPEGLAELVNHVVLLGGYLPGRAHLPADEHPARHGLRDTAQLSTCCGAAGGQQAAKSVVHLLQPL